MFGIGIKWWLALESGSLRFFFNNNNNNMLSFFLSPATWLKAKSITHSRNPQPWRKSRPSLRVSLNCPWRRGENKQQALHAVTGKEVRVDSVTSPGMKGREGREGRRGSPIGVVFFPSAWVTQNRVTDESQSNEGFCAASQVSRRWATLCQKYRRMAEMVASLSQRVKSAPQVRYSKQNRKSQVRRCYNVTL